MVASDLPGQFLLSTRLELFVPGWQKRCLGDWTLATHPALPVTELRTTANDPIGWLLGYAIDDSGNWLEDKQILSFASPATIAAAAFEDWLYGLGGRFIGILLANDLKRFYLDAGGTLAAVYAVAEPALASTESLLNGGPTQFTEPLQPNQFFPAGLTASANIRRLLPNHYLDLARWRPVRHWLWQSPRRAGADEIPSLVANIAGHVRCLVRAVTQRYATYLGLTAGRDSRMILACGRDVVQRMSFITFAYNEYPGDHTDVQAALLLAQQFGLRHQVVPIVAPTNELKEAYLQRIGHAGHWGKARDFYYACNEHLDLSRALLTGFAGEVGRGYYWPKITNGPAALDAAQLLTVMRLPHAGPCLTALHGWLEGFQPEDVCALLDQLYLEQRVGCWAAPHMYGAAAFAANLTPFCHRRVFESMLRLPIAYRRSRSLANDLVRLVWPELAELPFNRDSESSQEAK